MVQRTTFLLATAALGWVGCSVSGGRSEIAAGTVSIPTLTVDVASFLRGASVGKEYVISGELTLPEGAAGRVPAVVLMHGGSGVLDYQHVWARHLRTIGYATLVVDSFSGRGILRVTDDLEALSAASRTIDAYRALAVLAAHPRIDRERIAFMGFSHGATAGLYAIRDRFEKAFGPPDARYAGWILFYPYCNTRLRDEVPVTSAPIRVFHGSLDDWTPIAACREYVERVRASGGAIELREYPFAYHGFDNPRAPAQVRLERAMNPARCVFVEQSDGVVLNGETGRPYTYRDACWTRGVTAGYEPGAYADALAAVKAFLGALPRAPSGPR